ncbi:hypothetical protein RND81_06G077100 [Saponaria officinalis]|uniref:Reverse transcriptase zinc-binding domain-containing protein n=1 Tax=Saponaria officinalis TaxID=3572 RepID=A0AAW1K902_SAPOF
MCSLCADALESQEHLFFECVVSRKYLKILSSKLRIDIPWLQTWNWWHNSRFQNLFVKKLIGACLIAVFYTVWRSRNLCLFEQVLISPDAVMKKTCVDVQTRCRAVVSSPVVLKYEDWLLRLCS